jgi:hypothetical protein
MSTKERRVTPRKCCAIPIRVRTFASEYVSATADAAAANRLSAKLSSVRMATAEAEILEGEIVNLSERGISFKSPYRCSVGQSVELYFTLPRELTGRRPEEVRCNARVIHVDRNANSDGHCVVGAMIDRRSWEN